MRKSLVGIIVLAFAVRVAAMLLLQTWSFPSEREFGAEEGEIAFALANGQGFSWPQTWRAVGPPGAMAKRDHPVPTTWKAPIFPAIIAVAFWFFGSYTPQAAIALELFQILLSLLICYVLFRLGKLLFNEPAGLVAALIFALYPAAVHFSVQKIEYGVLLTLLGLLIIERTIEYSKRPSLARTLTLGALSGAAVLVNPVILAFCPFALLWFVWGHQSDWQSRLKRGATIVVCGLALMTPWLIRNYLVFNRFVFIRPNFARELVRSNFGQAARVLAAADPTATGGDDAQVSAFFNRTAVRLLLQEPAYFLRKTVGRVPTFWTYMSETTGRAQLVAGVAYFSVLVLALAGVWVARRQQQVRLLFVYLLTMPIPFYLTWAVKGRFRFPLEPILILFASYAVTFWLSRLRPSVKGLRPV